MGEYDKALRLAKDPALKQIVEGLALAHKEDSEKGNALVISDWTHFLQTHFRYPSTIRSEDYAQINLEWTSLPPDARRILTDARLNPESL